MSRRSWKEIQSKKQIAKKTKLALIILILVLGFLFFSKVLKFTQMLSSPWKGVSTKRSYSWNGDFNINILIHAKTISLLSFSPKKEQVVIVEIPNHTYLEVSSGFGKWMISSVYDLGQSQKELGGGILLKESLVDFFALPIDGFLDFGGQGVERQTTDIVSEIRQTFPPPSLLAHLTTDLTPLELIRLKMGLSSVRFDKIKQIDLLKIGVMQDDKLADGEKIVIADPIKLDSLVSTLADPTIQSEHKTIAIFNSTNRPGLAQKAARLITNMGGDVIIISNSSHKLKTTSLVGEKSKTLERLRQIFGSNATIAEEDKVSSRAQINLFLGEDYL